MKKQTTNTKIDTMQETERFKSPFVVVTRHDRLVGVDGVSGGALSQSDLSSNTVRVSLAGNQKTISSVPEPKSPLERFERFVGKKRAIGTGLERFIYQAITPPLKIVSTSAFIAKKTLQNQFTDKEFIEKNKELKEILFKDVSIKDITAGAGAAFTRFKFKGEDVGEFIRTDPIGASGRLSG